MTAENQLSDTYKINFAKCLQKCSKHFSKIFNAPLLLKVGPLSDNGFFDFKENPDLAILTMHFRGDASGEICVLFPQDTAKSLTSLALTDHLNTLYVDIITIDTITEIGNILINQWMHSFFQKKMSLLNYDIPLLHLSNSIQTCESKSNSQIPTNAIYHEIIIDSPKFNSPYKIGLKIEFSKNTTAITDQIHKAETENLQKVMIQ